MMRVVFLTSEYLPNCPAQEPHNSVHGADLK